MTSLFGLPTNPGELRQFVRAELDRSELSVQVRRLGNSEPWHEVSSFSNSWVNYDARTVRYFKDRSGVVHLGGIIKDGTLTAAAFTLPAGYRPFGSSTSHNHAVASNGAFGHVSVGSDGAVIPQSGSNVWVDLSSIHFRAEQ